MGNDKTQLNKDGLSPDGAAGFSAQGGGLRDEIEALNRELSAEDGALEAERRDLDAQLAEPDIVFQDRDERKAATKTALEQDENALQRERAGLTAGRISRLGLQSQDSALRQRQEAKKRNEATERAYYLALLQDHIAALEAQSAEYTRLISEFEDKHFTDEEQAYYDSLPEDERFKAKDEAMRKKLENGEITREEYERWAGWYKDKAETDAELDQFKDVMKHGTPEQQEQALKNHSIDTLKEGRHTLSSSQKVRIEDVMENRDDSGITKSHDSTLSLSAFIGGGSPSSVTSNSSSLSFAGKALPDDSLRGAAPPLEPKFNKAASQTEHVTPDAKVELARGVDPNAHGPSSGFV